LLGLARSISRSVVVAALLCAAACGPSAPPKPADSAAARVVSLAPAFTETLIALGAADAIVGIGRFDPPVPGHPDLPRLGDAMSVNLETLTALSPGAVLVNSTMLEEKLAPVASRLRVIRLPTDRLDEALFAVGEIARIVGREREGEALSATIRTALGSARARADERRRRGERPPRVLVVVQRRPLYTAGAGSFVDDLLRAVGAENVFGDVAQPWPEVGEESIVARAPDVILDASVGDVDTVAGREELAKDWQRFPTVPAVKSGRVLVIREDALFRAGPRIPEALAALERLLFAEGRAPR
jgi:ABC-type Fe3+-hydroxamate transport system substrate-binding protein